MYDYLRARAGVTQALTEADAQSSSANVNGWPVSDLPRGIAAGHCPLLLHLGLLGDLELDRTLGPDLKHYRACGRASGAEANSA
jgi:hypothetical protein